MDTTFPSITKNKKHMLIEGVHDEATYVALVGATQTSIKDGIQTPKLHEFYGESAGKVRKVGNIYWGCIQRVEPNLGAFFVDYGVEKNGFLPFSEISKLTISNVSESQKGKGKHYGLRKGDYVLVQLVKEERASKGAFLTTFIRLSGRFCKLFPNKPKGFLFSGRIPSEYHEKYDDLKACMNLDPHMGLMMRYASMGRSRVSIKRDVERTQKIWKSTIHALEQYPKDVRLVYEDGDLITAAMRDFYDRDVEKIIIDGENAYKKAQDIMGILMPTHKRKITLFKGNTGIFEHYGLNDAIDSIYQPQVQLPSGGEIVIHQTEALTAIDVNVKKGAHKQKNNKEAIMNTNREAAYAIAHHVRLRDLGGLMVVDFVDMERSEYKILEKYFKECLSGDPAHLHLCSISSLGLLEFSRQRLRHTLTDISFHVCHTCHGTGRMQSVESACLHVMRYVQRFTMSHPGTSFEVYTSLDVALYAFNHKKKHLMNLEEKHLISIMWMHDHHLQNGQYRLNPLAKENKESLSNINPPLSLTHHPKKNRNFEEPSRYPRTITIECEEDA